MTDKTRDTLKIGMDINAREITLTITADEAKEILTALSESTKWIPCSERLPEEDKEVLIFTKDKEINKAYHTLKEWSDTQWEWFVFGTLGYSLTYSEDEVLAWQPLPEPYKKGE